MSSCLCRLVGAIERRYRAAVVRILGVDLGLKRTGLAVGDPLGIAVRPLPTLTPRSRAEDVAFLVRLCAEEEVGHVAIGLALMARSGDDGAMAKRARGFAAALTEALRTAGLSTEVHLVDERGTSKEAAARLVDAGVRRSKRRAALDAEAACLLVEDLAARLRARRDPS